MTRNDPTPSGSLSAAELFREHGPFVARFLYRLGVPPEAIDDAVQDVFLVVHQRGGYRPGPAKPTTYLALIASRAASAQRRKQRLRASRLGPTEVDEVRTQDDDPERRAERRDDLRRLQDALSRLDPTLRDTLLLAQFEDESAPSIAHAMGVPVGTVYWRLHEARKKFQRALVLTDRSSAQAAATRLPSRQRAAALSRGAKLSIFFGLFDPKARGAEAEALLRAWRDASIDLDLARGLARHFDLARGVPAANTTVVSSASKLSLGSGAAFKIGAWAAGAACSVLAAFPLFARMPAAAHVEHKAQRTGVAHVMASAEPARSAANAPLRGAATPVEPARARATSVASGPEPRMMKARSGPVHAASAAPPRRAQEQLRPSYDADRSQPAEIPAAEHASVPQPVQTRPAVAGNDHEPLLEARALARADALLASDPAQSLVIVAELSRASRPGYLEEERQYVEVMALYGVGRQAEAEHAAERFLSRYRSSAFRERMKAARKTATSRP